MTFTANPGFGVNGNNTTVTFTAGAVAGSEVVTVSGTAITIQVSAGVSTVTQVVAAVNASPVALTLVSVFGSAATTVTNATVLSLSGGVNSTGLLRSTKLALDSANYVLINDNTGKMSSEAQLSTTRGGTGANITPTNVGDVLQVINGLKLGLSAAPVAPQSRIFSFYRFS